MCIFVILFVAAHPKKILYAIHISCGRKIERQKLACGWQCCSDLDLLIFCSVGKLLAVNRGLLTLFL